MLVFAKALKLEISQVKLRAELSRPHSVFREQSEGATFAFKAAALKTKFEMLVVLETIFQLEILELNKTCMLTQLGQLGLECWNDKAEGQREGGGGRSWGFVAVKMCGGVEGLLGSVGGWVVEGKVGGVGMGR
ncbi:MAG: hypothetical protein ACKERG_03920 [Candidatus Hodgkinia cicadicola]